MTRMRWDARRYAEGAAFVPAHGVPVVDLLAAQPGERVLDLGCGDGALTALIAERGAAVVGVDASPEMAAAARARGLDARVHDAQRLAFAEEFDAVFTSAALHWMPDLPAVLIGVRRALVPGGRFVGEFAAAGNVAAIGLAVTAARLGHGLPAPGNPWRTCSADEFADLLAGAGLSVDGVEVFPRPTPLPDGLRGWLDVFGEPLLAGVPAPRRAAVVAAAVELARPWMADSAGRWNADYVRLRFRAHRPALRDG